MDVIEWVEKPLTDEQFAHLVLSLARERRKANTEAARSAIDAALVRLLHPAMAVSGGSILVKAA